VPVSQLVTSSSEQKFISTHTFFGTHNFKFFVPGNVKQLTLKITTGRRENHPGDRVMIIDAAGKILFDDFIVPDGATHDVLIVPEVKGLYSMRVSDQKIGFSIQFPDWLPFAVVDYFVIPDWQKKVYFYVPQGTKKIAMFCESVVPVKIYDGDGKEIKYKGTKVIVADVPDGQDGRVWALSHHKFYTPSPIMLNIPRIIGFSKDTMLIPAQQIK